MTAKNPFATRRRRKKKSMLQQAHLARGRSMAHNAGQTENTIQIDKKKPSKYVNRNQKLWIESSQLKMRTKDLMQIARNRLKVARRAKMRVKQLVSEKQKSTKQLEIIVANLEREQQTNRVNTDRFCTLLDRINKSKSYWKKRALAAKEANRYMRAKKLGLKRSLKPKLCGAYTPEIRSLCRKLVMLGIAAKQVPNVIRLCARAFGIEPGSLPGPRSVGRFVLEGGAAAKIQLGNILSEAQGITTSMDSTSHRNINFSSMHIMANSLGAHNQLYLAVESTTDHTSQTQVDVLKRAIDTVCDTTRRAPKSESSTETTPSTSDLARKLYGVNGDHASDQLKVAQLEKEWKIDSWVNHLGNLALSNLNSSESKVLYESIYAHAQDEAGGLENFSTLSLADQEDLLASEHQKCIWNLGKTAFNDASPVLQQDMSCVVRGGCCAHKDMNATKGGASAMSAFWRANKQLTPPVKLFNKDNNATVSLAENSGNITEAEKRAIHVTEAGAIKLCSLAGAAYNHKDDKKGHQDSHAYWFAQQYGRFRRFPDTSNVRYSSFIDAATELCTSHSAYIDYMEHIRKQRATGRLNHLESNIAKALKCSATLAELVCIALYGQIISKPYIRLVRSATAKGKGLADLALLHAQVQCHLQNLISNPCILSELGSAPSSAVLDGSDWDNPAVSVALKDHGLKMPYFTDLFVAFCQGASQTWNRFTDELSPSAPIASLTSEQYTKAFMPPTNDANEGALGTWRVWARRFPSLTLHKFNAITMNKANQTEAYIEEHFTLKQHKWTRAEARHMDSSKLEANRKAMIVDAQIKEAAKNETTLLRREERRNKREEYISGIKLVLEPTAIQKMVGKQLDDQLKAYKKIVIFSSGEVFPPTSKLKVAQKRELVTGLAEKYVQERSLRETGAPDF